MRWALSRTPIPYFGGLIPQKPNRSSVEGTLIHELIESFENFTRRQNVEVFRPRRILLELVAAWAKSNESNPRIDSKALAGQVRLEEILRAFRDASGYIKTQECQSNVGSLSESRRWGIFNGAESWLRDPKSKLCGRADIISAGEIIDFKSGEQHKEHVEQIVFYAGIYLALTGQVPTALRVIYTTSNQIQDVPVPALSELESILQDLRQRADTADRRILAGDLQAKPEPNKCTYCQVRGLCDKYWFSLSNGNQSEIGQQAAIVDYAPSTKASIEKAALGIYVRDESSGVPSVLHLQQEVADKVGERLGSTRFLALRANPGPDGVRFTLTHGSEIFINCVKSFTQNE